MQPIVKLTTFYRFSRYAPFEFLFFNWSRRIKHESIDDPRILILPEDQLELGVVQFESPGFWEFLGSLNPLQQLREYLNDRHGRTKDLKYRNKAEQIRLDMENERLAVQIFSEKVEALQKAGVSQDEIRRLLVPAAHSLNSVATFQDQGLIETAELTQVENLEH